MTKIIDMDRIYDIEKGITEPSGEVKKIYVWSHGDSYSGGNSTWKYDVYGTVKDNSIFKYNHVKYQDGLYGIEFVEVKNHTNKTIRVHCTGLEYPQDPDTVDLPPNGEHRFNTDDAVPEVTITFLDVFSYEKSTEYVQGFNL